MKTSVIDVNRLVSCGTHWATTFEDRGIPLLQVEVNVIPGTNVILTKDELEKETSRQLILEAVALTGAYLRESRLCIEFPGGHLVTLSRGVTYLAKFPDGTFALLEPMQVRIPEETSRAAA